MIVPNSSAEPLTLRSGTKGFDFYLPFSDKGSEARFEQNGVVSFDNQNGSTSVAVVKGDGNLQVLTIINNASAPSQYDYEIVLPDDGRIVETEDGALIVLGAEDDFLGVALPPWAKDSNGKDVPTRYEVRGNVVTQVVDHLSTEVLYPITADPFWGLDLFTGFVLGSDGGQSKYTAWVTPWGATVLGGGGGIGGYLIGQVIFLNEGWNEWKAKWPVITNKASLWQQFECHTAAGQYGLFFTQDWNLERKRPNRTTHWSHLVLTHRCNWNTPDGA